MILCFRCRTFHVVYYTASECMIQLQSIKRNDIVLTLFSPSLSLSLSLSPPLPPPPHTHFTHRSQGSKRVVMVDSLSRFSEFIDSSELNLPSSTIAFEEEGRVSL